MNEPLTGPLDLSLVNVVTGAALVLLAIGLAQALRTGVTKSLAWAAFRCTVQLLLLGYVLVWIFAVNTWWAVAAAFLIMLSVAGWTASRRTKKPIPGLMGLTTGALAVGGALTAVVVTAFVIRVDPFWEPRYFLPLSGMIIGNSMNAVALAAERLQSEIGQRRNEIEEILSLGATPRQAVQTSFQATMRAAFLPLVNMMLTAGVVSIPGMMNGQILAGADPALASRYQIVVMFMIAAAVTMSATLLGILLYRRFFTPAWQLRHELLPEG